MHVNNECVFSRVTNVFSRRVFGPEQQFVMRGDDKFNTGNTQMMHNERVFSRVTNVFSRRVFRPEQQFVVRGDDCQIVWAYPYPSWAIYTTASLATAAAAAILLLLLV